MAEKYSPPLESPRGDKVYLSPPNREVVAYLGGISGSLLDVGCGDGANSRALLACSPRLKVWGITHSPHEAARAAEDMEACHVTDIEGAVPEEIARRRFDTILFSHILEHVREPRDVVSRWSRLLHDDGRLLIVLPNILSWAMRWRFLRGNFEYEEYGILDETHLRFFTFESAARFFSLPESGLRQSAHFATGSFPLCLARRYFFSRRLCERIDQLATARWPNLFGTQIFLELRKAHV